MDSNEAHTVYNQLVEGQAITVHVASGRQFQGIYDGELSNPDNALHFDTLDGNPLRAEWDKITKIDYRAARAVASKMMVPPEHPYAPVSARKKPYTTRNS